MNTITLSPAARAALGRTSADTHQALTADTKFLLALNAKAQRSGTPVFAGISATERASRRAAGRRQRAARKAAR